MISLRLYDRNGTTLIGLLPDLIDLSVSLEFSEVGAIQFSYSTKGINAAELTHLREIAVVNPKTGDEFVNGRFVITSINRDRAEIDGQIRVTGKSILWRLETALAYPTGGLGAGNERVFTSSNAGTIMKTVIDAATARGALSGITTNFTNSTDSAGQSWVGTVTQSYSARQSLLSILRSLIDADLVEAVTSSRQIQLYKAGGYGTDRTTGSTPVILRHGFNLTEAPEQASAEQLSGVILAEGDKALLVEQTDATTISTYGRLESSLTVSGVTDSTVASTLASAYLDTAKAISRQLTVGLSLHDAAPKPLFDFTVGDYVYTATTAGLERVRVRQVTVSLSSGAWSATATLGDRIFENEVRQSRRLSSLTAGSTQGGSGTLPAADVTLTPDAIAPSAPTGLTGTSSSYTDVNLIKSSVALTWTAPTTNADGSTLTDLRDYNVYYRRGATDAWQFAASSTTNSATVPDLSPSTSYRFSVTAFDAFANESARSSEFVITTSTQASYSVTPSTPTVTSRLGTLSVTWNGLNSVGGSMGATFSYVEVHASTTSGFTPTSATYEGRMNGSDTLVLSDLTYGSTYYVKLVPYSTAGVAGSASAQASATIQRLVDTDLIANTLTTWPFNGAVVSATALQDGSVNAAKLTDNAVTANKILSGAVDSLKLADAAVSAAKIATGAVGSNAISAGAITAGKIAAGAVTATEIAAGSITSAKIVAGAIGATEIAAGAITAGKISAGAVGATEIAANAIVAGKIATGAVTAGTIAALAIQAGDIAANAITADKINAGAVTAAKIDATAIDGKTITGSTIRTSANTARVEMTSSGLFAYNTSGTQTFGITASNGAASFTGTITSSSITCGTFTVTTSGTLSVSTGTIGGFTIGSSTFGDGTNYISTGATTGAASFNNYFVRASSGSTGISMQNGGNITMGGGNITGAGTVSGTTITGTNLSASSDITSSGTLNITGNAAFSGASNTFPNITQSTSAANLRWGTTTGGRLFESTASSARFKTDIVNLTSVPELDPKQLLDLPVRAFRYRDDYLGPEDERSGVLVPGFIAEEVDQIYPIVADYELGRPNNWNDKFLVPAMLSLIQDLYKEIDQLKGSA